MVVTRRTSIPMPPASRTSSSQATPKLNKAKIPQSSPLGHDIEDELLNGDSSSRFVHEGPQFSDDALFSDGSPPRKVLKDRTKSKTRKKEAKASRRRKRPSTWLDFFSRVFILAFLIYSLSVCPTADKEKSPVCRALAEYRRLVLEPYVITPVQNLLHHPSVSPYTMPVIEKAEPIIMRTRHEWNSRVVPQWKTHVVPQWEKHIVPLWNSHVSPQLSRLDAKVDPYRQQASELYKKRVALYVERGRILAYKTRPYLILAGAKTHDAYQISRPYLARIYQELQRVPPFVAEYAIRPLASARRQYVDPHVVLLLEKMQELSSGSTKVHNVTDNANHSTDPTSTVTKEAGYSGASAEVEVPSVNEPYDGEGTLASASSVASASLSHGTRTGSIAPSEESETKASASSVLSASAVLGDHASESVPGATYSPSDTTVETKQTGLGDLPSDDEAFAASSTNVPETKASGVNDTVLPSAATGQTQEIPFQAQSANGDSNGAKVDDDLDDLLAELGLDIEETIASEIPPTPSVKEESEEEKAAREARRLAEVAEKRRELQARHTRWEEKLADTIKAQTVVVKEEIASIRRTGAAELKINLAIRAAIETLNSEGEKALRGTDAYFTKLKAGGKPRAEQARLWDRVLEKVQAKFEERVQDVEEIVNKWYQEEVLSKEMQEINRASDAVRTVADDAQADIGLDYAWLDDVTVLDWKRYHALLDRHREFLDEQLALANGSHPDAFANSVLEAFEDLQSEVQDITIGFETRMRRIKREGERAFADDQAEPEPSAPEVSILPVSMDGKKEDKAFQEVADAILGRSGEEVEEALGRAEEGNAGAPHEEL